MIIAPHSYNFNKVLQILQRKKNNSENTELSPTGVY